MTGFHGVRVFMICTQVLNAERIQKIVDTYFSRGSRSSVLAGLPWWSSSIINSPLYKKLKIYVHRKLAAYLGIENFFIQDYIQDIINDLLNASSEEDKALHFDRKSLVLNRKLNSLVQEVDWDGWTENGIGYGGI